MKINALGYVGFSSPKYAEWRTFGPEILGVSLAADGADGSVRLRMDERHHRLAFHPGETEDVAYIGWEIPSRVDFEAALEELRTKQIRFSMATPEELEDRCVQAMAKLSDPSGYRHEIYHGQLVEPEPFLPTRPISGFVSGALGGVGHIVLVVPEVSQAHADFALNVLGLKTFIPLRLSNPDGSAHDVEFYRCNRRTHCLAYIPGRGMRGVNHIYLEVHTLDDVGRTYDLVRDRGIPIPIDLGRFLPDTDVSFYLRSPSGWDIQYATGGELLAEEDDFVAPLVDASAGKSIAWGHRMLLPGWNPSIRRVENAD